MVGPSAGSAAKKVRRLPIMQGVLPIVPAEIPTDVIAGITLAALAIPEVMGYTKIAGMPVITGLYTILVPIAVFALLGSSRHLVVGADSATAAIMFAGLSAIGIAPYSSQWVALAGWLAIISAAYLIAARFLHLGFLADFLSRTVLIGFLTGVGIQVALGQLAGMLGVEKTGKGPILQAFNALKDIPQANPTTVAVSVAVLVVIVGSGLISKKIPGALIAVVGSILASWWLNLAAKGVATLGNVPSGLPHFGVPALPSASQWTALLAGAGSLFLIILAQSAATSRAYAVKYDDAFDENVDLVGLGLANVAAGLSATFPVNGSPTKTQMVDDAGGKSQISQLTTAVIVLVVLLFLTKPLSFMPEAVLASVVFLIGVELINVKGMREVYALRPVEFWVAAITTATVVVVGVEQGIILAIVLSVIIHLRHSYRPYNALISWENDALRLSPVSEHAEAAPGLIIYHFGASVYYANADSLGEDFVAIQAQMGGRLKWLVLEASAIQDIDYTGAQVIAALARKLKRDGVEFGIVDALAPVAKELKEGALAESIPAEMTFQDPRSVLAAYLKQHDGSGSGGASADDTSGSD